MRACDIKIKCEKCGKLVSKPNFTKHLRKHEKYPETIFHEHISTTVCPCCGKTFKTAIGCGLHLIYCEKNPNKKVKQSHGAGNKGLTKEDPRVAKYAATTSKVRKGCQNHLQSEETKAKISASRKRYLEEHPDQAPFKLNHSSHESFPEKYFRKGLTKNNLFEKQELQVSRYTLDFAGENKKAYLEIDGSQHHLDGMVEHDKERTDFLDNLGGRCIARVYWPDYQKLNKHQKHLYLVELKQKILNIV